MKKQLTKKELYCKDKQLVDIIEKMRIRKQNQSQSLTVKNFCDKLIEKRLYEIAHALPNHGYIMDSFVNVILKGTELRQCDYRTSEYATTSNYKANHGSVNFQITPQDLRHTYVVGGLVTYIYPDQKSKVKRCYWISRIGFKQYFILSKVEGYVYEDFHSVYKNEAKKGGERNLMIRKNDSKNAKLFKKAARLQYNYDDSIAAGNCAVGTQSFISFMHLNISKSYRGTYLLKVAQIKSKSSVAAIKRMIEFKATVILTQKLK
jgi:hypothetical protein